LIQLDPLPPITTNINITSMDITLLGTAASGNAFMRNPTSCGTKTTGFEADSYADPGTTVTGSASYESTGCESLPFHPSFSAHLGAPGQTGPTTKTPATTVIGQTDDEAGLKRAQVNIPSVLGANTALFNSPCTPASFDAGTCPASSIIGDASATSPLLSQAIPGPGAPVGPPRAGLPPIGLHPRGPLALKLLGSLTLTPPGIVFDGLPDIPISTFQLHFNGEPNGMLIATADLCQPPAPSFHTDFTGHNGAHATGDTQAVIEGCGAKGEPTVKLKLAKKRSKPPKLRLSAHSGINKIRSVSVKVPKPLKLAGGKSWKRGARGTADGGKLDRGAITHSKKAFGVDGGDGGLGTL